MSIEEIQIALRVVLGEMQVHAVVAYLIGILLAAGAAFAGAYLKKRGENLATKADYEALRMQLIENTRITEEVKASVASIAWAHQRHWTQNEKYFGELLTLIATSQGLMRRTKFAFEAHEKTGKAFSPEEIERMEKALQAYEQIRVLLAPARLYLSDEAVRAVTDFTEFRFLIEPGANLATQIDTPMRKLTELQDALVAEGKKHLSKPTQGK